MTCVSTLQLEVPLGTSIPAVHLEHSLSPWPYLAHLGALPQSSSWLYLPTSGHGGARLLKEIPAPVCPMPVWAPTQPGAPHSFHSLMCPHRCCMAHNLWQITKRALWWATCDSSTPAQSEARMFALGFPLPGWIYTYAKGSLMHLVLTCLATRVSVTGEKHLYWNAHIDKQHSMNTQPQGSPEEVTSSQIWISKSWPWTPGLWSSWYQISPPLLPHTSCDPQPFLQ